MAEGESLFADTKKYRNTFKIKDSGTPAYKKTSTGRLFAYKVKESK